MVELNEDDFAEVFSFFHSGVGLGGVFEGVDGIEDRVQAAGLDMGEDLFQAFLFSHAGAVDGDVAAEEGS